MPQVPYEVFEHTADVGIFAYGSSLPELFVHASQGMQSLLVAPEQVRSTTQREIAVSGHDTISLLIAWLNELVFLFDTEFLLLRDFVVDELTESSARGRAWGEPYDVQHHDLGSAIKAATWHEASIEQTADGYRARIIFDI